MDLDTGLLRSFIAVADTGSFTRAATELGITQQAVSKRISKLEAVLGASLIDRHDRRRCSVSSNGARLLDEARAVVAATDAFAELARHKTSLVVAVPDEHSAPMTWLRTASLRDGPGVEVIADPEPFPALTQGRADFAILRAGALDSALPLGITGRPLVLEPVSLLVGERHALAHREAVDFAELKGLPVSFPLTGAPPEWRGWLASFAEASGIRVDTTGSTLGFETWGVRVAEGVTASLVGEEMLSPAAGGLRVLPIDDPTPVFAWWIVWAHDNAGRHLDSLVERMSLERHHISPSVLEGVWLPETDRRLLTAWFGR